MKFFDFLISATLLGLSTNVEAQECQQIYRRPNIYTMGFEKMNRYFNAIKQLNSGPRPTQWDALARKHVEFYPQVHSDPKFLSWHRFYLNELETKLREIDNTIRIPYWDWSVHYDDMTQDPIWQFFGGTGNPNDGCIRDGPFADFPVFYGHSMDEPGSERCSRRRSSFDRVFTGSKSTVNSIIDADSDTKFWEDLEYGPHGSTHNGVGGDFSGHAAPNDPLFWSHHAFVDKIWFDRQMRHSENTFTYPISARTIVPGYGRPILESFDPVAFCYTYVQDNYSWDATVRMQRAMNIAPPEPFVALAASNLTRSGIPSESEIKQHAKDYVMNGVFAPDMNDGPKFGPSSCRIHPIPNPVDIEYIRNMKYNEETVRRIERQTALRISEENQQCANS